MVWLGHEQLFNMTLSLIQRSFDLVVLVVSSRTKCLTPKVKDCEPRLEVGWWLSSVRFSKTQAWFPAPRSQPTTSCHLPSPNPIPQRSDALFRLPQALHAQGVQTHPGWEKHPYAWIFFNETITNYCMCVSSLAAWRDQVTSPAWGSWFINHTHGLWTSTCLFFN